MEKCDVIFKTENLSIAQAIPISERVKDTHYSWNENNER